MKIVIFEVEAWERETFRDLEAAHVVVFVAEPLGPGNADAHADAEVVSTFIYSDLGGAVLTRLTALRFIATRSTGFDHIDLALCRERGIVVAFAAARAPPEAAVDVAFAAAPPFSLFGGVGIVSRTRTRVKRSRAKARPPFERLSVSRATRSA